MRPRGLVLVTGPTGSGKSTTLAAMVDFVNLNRSAHIITVEECPGIVSRNKYPEIISGTVRHHHTGFSGDAELEIVPGRWLSDVCKT